MNYKLIKKIVLFIILFVGIRILLISGIDRLNINLTNIITITNNKIKIDKDLENNLYKVEDFHINNDEITLYIKQNNRQSISILINNLTFNHKIYIDDMLISQNVDKLDAFYDNDYAYKHFNIEDFVDNNSLLKLKVKGIGVSKINIFLANQEITKNSIEIRIVFYTFLLTCLILLTLLSFIFFIRNIQSKVFLILTTIGIVSIIKSLNLGELSAISSFFGLTAYNSTIINNITSIINTALPILAILYLYQIKLINRAKTYFVTFIVICLFVFLYGGVEVLYYFSIIIVVILSVIINFYGYIEEKPFCMAILINDIMYSSLANYNGLISINVYKRGVLNFFINSAYLGAVIYLSGFLLIFILDYFKKIRVLEQKEKEYERVVLLRGISHDLKLPLSVIKMSSQMLEKYNMEDEKKKRYIKANIQAVTELEKMTDNINSYLKLGDINDKNIKTSIKNSFRKLKNHFDIYNRNKEYKFTVIEDDKDYILSINPIQFDRMMYNLVDNAFKYSKEQGSIKVSYKVNKGVIIIVEDEGIGIDEDQINKIFSPFYRIDNSRNKEGLGLGLSVVKGIVDDMKGQIIIDTEINIGTKVIIILK